MIRPRRRGRVRDRAVRGAVLLTIACTAPEPPPAPLHPDLPVTILELRKLSADLPAGVRDHILATPELFLDLVVRTLELPPELLTLVDKESALDTAYEPGDLIELAGRGLTMTRSSMPLSASALPDLMAMVAAARLTGTDVTISSTYRSFARQASLFDQTVGRLGLQAASTLVARPGHSQHQLGTTIDFGSIDLGYEQTDEGRWVLENAWRFGFSLSYPKGLEKVTGYDYEPWHFRYIGRAAAELERRFFAGVQQVFLSTYQALLPRLTGEPAPAPE